MRFFENLYYGFKLRSFSRSHKVDYSLGQLILKILREKEYTIERERNYLNIVTPNFTMKMWNNNKYYSWLSNGEITDICGTIIYKWKDTGISSKHIWEIRKLLGLDSLESNCTVDWIMESLDEL